MTPKGIPILTEKSTKRFWSLVDVKGAEECWPLKKVVREDGYGRVRINGQKHYAHRIAFVAAGKQFTNGPHVRHVVCANRRCCNPAHLESGTKQDNADDREKDGHTSRGERHSKVMTPLIRSRAKLSMQKAMDIRSLYSGGATQGELASRFGVTQSLISAILLQKRWVA